MRNVVKNVTRNVVKNITRNAIKNVTRNAMKNVTGNEQAQADWEPGPKLGAVTENEVIAKRITNI